MDPLPTDAIVWDLEAERLTGIPPKPPPPGLEPITPERAAENLRVLEAALKAGPDRPPQPLVSRPADRSRTRPNVRSVSSNPSTRPNVR
jgi:hypothetical protein